MVSAGRDHRRLALHALSAVRDVGTRRGGVLPHRSWNRDFPAYAERQERDANAEAVRILVKLGIEEHTALLGMHEVLLASYRHPIRRCPATSRA